MLSVRDLVKKCRKSQIASQAKCAAAAAHFTSIFKQRNANTHGMNDGGNIPNGPVWPGAGSQLPHPGSINNALPPEVAKRSSSA